jgi:hypothetical protein
MAIEATPEEVWAVLTDYEALPEFVPNLALCERLPVPPGLASRLVRLRQVSARVGLFPLLPMALLCSPQPCLHAEWPPAGLPCSP